MNACTELVGVLRTAGYVADIDPEALSPHPACVWVRPRTIRDWTLGGGATLVADLFLIVGNTETGTAMSLLDDQLEGLLQLVDPAVDDPTVDLMASIVLPTNPSAPLPAYRLAVDLEL